MKKQNPKREFDSHTLNSTKTVFLCSDNRPCKRITTCSKCNEKRKNLFIHAGIVFSKQWCLDHELVVSWSIAEDMSAWETLITSMQQLSKLMSARNVGKYIRVISVGPKGNPHVHFLVNSETAGHIESITKKKWPSNQSNTLITKLHNVEGKLGYFYDVNYAYSMHDPNRIKRTKLISASRPFPCGFPKPKQGEFYESGIEAEVYKHFPFMDEVFLDLLVWRDNSKESTIEP